MVSEPTQSEQTPPPDFNNLFYMVGQVFNPNTPVSERDLFAGRTNQINRIVEVIYQKGQHAIIFGERGVGKTSLANVLSSFVSPSIKLLSTKVNCDKQDTFQSVWRKAFDEMQLSKTRISVGFLPSAQQQNLSSTHFFPVGVPISPNDVRKALIQLSQNFLPLIIFDEFDRLNEEVRKIFADLIKSLSDYSLTTTIVLIGVGESVNELIKEHQSVSRALMQVQMPRMNKEEILEILKGALNKLGMTASDELLVDIFLLSKGLPHYAHLIGRNAAKDALSIRSLEIKGENLGAAIIKALEDSQQSIKTDYHKAIKSAYKDSLFAEVLLACALADVNEFGEFAAQDLRSPMLEVTHKTYAIPQYAQHLKEFSESKRGNILTKSGERRFYRYKFTDPLMQPYIIMEGITNKKITRKALN